MNRASLPIVAILALGLAAGTAAEESPEVFVQLGNFPGILCAAFSPDGSTAAVGCRSGCIKTWDLASGREIRSFPGHSENIYALCYTPDGRRILSGGADAKLTLWEAASGREIRSYDGLRDSINAIALSPDGRLVLAGDSWGHLALLELETGREVRRFSGHSQGVNSVAFSPDGRLVLSCSSDKTVRLWEAATGTELRSFAGPSTQMQKVAFSADGRLVASGGGGKKLFVWDASTGAQVLVLSGGADGLAFSPDGRSLLATDGDKALAVRDARVGRELLSISREGRGAVFAWALSPDGKRLLTGHPGDSLLLWDVESGHLVREMGGTVLRQRYAAFSPDGKYLLSGGNSPRTTFFEPFPADGRYSVDPKYIASLVLWDSRQGKRIRTFSGHLDWVERAAFIPGGGGILSGGFDRALRRWDLGSGIETATFLGHSDSIEALAASPDGRWAVTGSEDGTVRFWDLASGTELRSWKAGKDDNFDILALSPDGRYLAAGSKTEGRFKLWDVAKGATIRSFPEKGSWVQALAFSPDGRSIAAAVMDGSIGLWSVESGAELRRLPGCRGTPLCLAFSPDGSRLASCGPDRGLRIWEVGTGRQLASTGPAGDPARSVAFSPDGSRLCTAEADGAVRVRKAADLSEIVAYVCFVDGEWIAQTPDGFFAASANGAKKVNVRIGGRVFGMDNLFERYYRPDIVQARLEGRDTSRLAAAGIRQGIKIPPRVSLSIQGKDGAYVEVPSGPLPAGFDAGGAVSLRVSAVDAGGGIGGLRLANNGKIVGEGRRGLEVKQAAGRLDRVFKVSLFDGPNFLSATAMSDDGSESNPVEVALSYARAKPAVPRMVILAVGIGEYRNPRYRLNYAVADAKGFVEAVRPKAAKLFSEVLVHALYDRGASRAKLLEAIELVAAEARPEDVFVFYYAGHGIAIEEPDGGGAAQPEFYYILSEVTQMADPARCAAEGLSGAEVRAMLARIAATKQVLFVDACNSGALASSFAVRGAADEIALAKLSRASGSAIFASTTKDQFAAEFAELGHGAFTSVLIDALGGAASLPNGQLTVASVKSFVDDRIPEVTLKYKGEEQFPTTFIWGQDFPLGLK